MSDKCDSTTHYHGCKCHEAKRDAKVAALEARVGELEGIVGKLTRHVCSLCDASIIPSCECENVKEARAAITNKGDSALKKEPNP